jgi:hypothetical protein
MAAAQNTEGSSGQQAPQLSYCQGINHPSFPADERAPTAVSQRDAQSFAARKAQFHVFNTQAVSLALDPETRQTFSVK